MAKSPTRRSRQSNSPFSKAQEIWIIQRSASMNVLQLRRAFIREFSGWKSYREWHVKCKREGDSKLMAWCGVVDGRMLVVRWMVDEDGRPQSVTSQRYQEVQQSQVWPEVRNRSSRRQYWFRQDGATSHSTNLNLNFWTEKFCGRVISCQAQEGHFWPPYSPNLNTLDFCVGGTSRTK